MKTFFILVLMAIAAMFSARLTRPLLLESANFYSTSSHNRKRLFEFQKFEKQIIDSKIPPSFIFGASSVEGFMDARVLDQKFENHHIDLNFYNLGFPMLSYLELSILAADIQERLSHANRKAEVSFIRLEPALLTKKFFNTLKSRESKFEFERLINLPTGGFVRRLLNSSENLIYGTGGSDDFNFWLSDLYVSRQEKKSNIHYAPWIFRQLQEVPEWNYEKRGNYDFNKEHSADFFAAIMKKKASPELESFAWAEMTRRFGSNEFDFDEKLISEALEDIKIISKFSKHTIVFFYPDRGAAQNLTEQGQKNLGALFARIKAQESVDFVLIDAQKLEHKDYYDPTHLSPSGWDKTSDILVEETMKSFEN